MNMQELHIETVEQLTGLCDLISGSQWLALDTEFVREKSYYPNFCLLQVSNGEVAASVDPLSLDELSPLLEIIYDPKVTKIFHAGRQDLEIFHNLWGKLPTPLFDTQLAATLLGLGDQVGYGNLVKQLLGRQLEKGHARTDWSRRPLQQDQLRYALDDVIYLGEIYLKLVASLRELGRERWLEEDFDMLSTPATYIISPDKAWQRIKGRQYLKGVQLAILQALASWRESEAQRANKPKRWILKDEVLTELSKRQPKDIKQLERIRGLETGTINRKGDTLLKLIGDARQLPKEQWPEEKRIPPRLDSNQEAIADLLVCSLRLLAKQNNITHTALATRKDLEKMITGARDLDILHGWRRALAGDDLLNVLEGKLLPVIKDSRITLQQRDEGT